MDSTTHCAVSQIRPFRPEILQFTPALLAATLHILFVHPHQTSQSKAEHLKPL